MTKDLAKNNEHWEYVVEQIKATITEAVHNSRWMLIEGYWNIGKLLREEFGNKDLTKTLSALSVDVNLSERTLWLVWLFVVVGGAKQKEMIAEIMR